MEIQNELKAILLDIPKEGILAPKSHDLEPSHRETYPYFFLRDGTKVLAESQEALKEFERLAKLTSSTVNRTNFYYAKYRLLEKRELPEQAKSEKDAETLYQFITDGQSQWSTFLTMADSSRRDSHLPKGFQYHFYVERYMPEIKTAASKLLEGKRARLLCKAIAQHLYKISSYSAQYGVFEDRTPTLLQDAIIRRSIDVAVWLLVCYSPNNAQTGIEVGALRNALVTVAHDLKDRSAHDVLSKAQALFQFEAGTQDLVESASVEKGKPKRKRTKPGATPEWLALGLAQLKDSNGSMTDADIARRVGVDKSTLAKSAQWRNARENFRGSKPTATKFEKRRGEKRALNKQFNAESNAESES